MVTLIALSSKHYAILALHTSRGLNGTRINSTMTNVAPAHAGVNILLGGAMMSCILIMVVCICYLCHWRFQKAEGQYERRHSWMQVAESDTSVHVFTLEPQCYEENPVHADREVPSPVHPPPDYDDVVAMDKAINEHHDPELPSYETALKLSSQGYV